MVATSYEGTPRAVRIKRFLMRDPQPASVAGLDAEGEKKTVKISAGSRYKWSDATKLLYQCVQITALDAQGKELRTLPIGPDDDAELHEDAVTEARAQVSTEFRSVMAREVTALVREISKAMVEVADAAAQRHSDHMTTAFNALVGLVQAQAQLHRGAVSQLAQLQRALGTVHGQQPQLGGEDAVMQQLMMSVLNGGGGGLAPQQQNGNGGGVGIQLTPDVIAQLAQRFMGGGAPAAAAPAETIEPEDEPAEDA